MWLPKRYSRLAHWLCVNGKSAAMALPCSTASAGLCLLSRTRAGGILTAEASSARLTRRPTGFSFLQEDVRVYGGGVLNLAHYLRHVSALFTTRHRVSPLCTNRHHPQLPREISPAAGRDLLPHLFSFSFFCERCSLPCGPVFSRWPPPPNKLPVEWEIPLPIRLRTYLPWWLAPLATPISFGKPATTSPPSRCAPFGDGKVIGVALCRVSIAGCVAFRGSLVLGKEWQDRRRHVEATPMRVVWRDRS